MVYLDFGIEHIPWPGPGDILFKDSRDTKRVAIIGGSSKSIGAYAVGYRDAAILIMNNIDSYQPFLDLIFYPIAFLYSHATELTIKELILLHARHSGVDVSPIITHDLMNLWQLSRRIIEEYSDGEDIDFLDPSESIIKELSEIKPVGEAFRYPTDTKGNELIPEDSGIDVVNFSEVMEGLLNALEGSVDWLEDLLRNSEP